MHPAPQFRWEDRVAMRSFVREFAFGTLFAGTPDGPRVAHLPVTWDGDERLTFHVSRANLVARHLDGATALFVATGPHGYVSPDWYGLGPDQVPTWNYVAVELEGRVTALGTDALVAQLDQLSTEQEAGLQKTPWTRDKMDAGKFDKLTSAIQAFALDITAWRGTRKLGQNKPDAARLSAAAAMQQAGSVAIADWMRRA